MKIIKPTDPDRLREYVRTYVPAGDGAEMICSALAPDTNIVRKVALDERGLAGAISYGVRVEAVRIFSLGSLRKGAGRALVKDVERVAKRRRLPLTVASMASAVGFYERLGFILVKWEGRTIAHMERRGLS